MQNFSIHTHTTGYDGKNTIKEMIEQAKKLDWSAIGISNHIVFHENMPLFHPMFYSDYKIALEYYKRTVEEIKEQALHYNISVLVGFEVDFFKSRAWRNNFEKLIDHIEYDYLIGSTHCLYNENESKIYQLYDYTRPKFPEKEFIDSYWDNIKESIKSGYFDIIAHIDLIKVFGLDNAKYWNDKLEIAHLLAKYNVATELNTGGRAKYNDFYPSLELLQELNKNNVSLLISDDAHSKDDLGNYYIDAENMLNSIKYKNRFDIKDLQKK